MTFLSYGNIRQTVLQLRRRRKKGCSTRRVLNHTQKSNVENKIVLNTHDKPNKALNVLAGVVVAVAKQQLL
jgi:hypothetical protein